MSDFPTGRLGDARKELRSWYRRIARPLPWRESRDPYTVWISEIMLQQTTVAAVIPYFHRFLERFPTVAHLAQADEGEVLKLWEGLGYYSRARNLRRAAQVIEANHSGVFPDSVEGLQSLPGIGRYTAGAIVSFAYDRPAPIVEANTLRLYSRLLGLAEDPRSTAGQRVLWEFAGLWPAGRNPGEVNQALMELGATLCTPQSPRCDDCPLAMVCEARRTGRQAEIPPPPRRPEVTDLAEVAVVVHQQGQFLLMQRMPGERWAGLWDFLRFDERETAEMGLPAYLQQRFGLETGAHQQFLQLSHGVTRYRIALRSVHCEWRSGTPRDGDRPLKWVSQAELGETPLPVTGRKIADVLAKMFAGPLVLKGDQPRGKRPRRPPTRG
jgi:A/G-specific adenine glycosylase